MIIVVESLRDDWRLYKKLWLKLYFMSHTRTHVVDVNKMIYVVLFHHFDGALPRECQNNFALIFDLKSVFLTSTTSTNLYDKINSWNSRPYSKVIRVTHFIFNSPHLYIDIYKRMKRKKEEDKIEMERQRKWHGKIVKGQWWSWQRKGRVKNSS